MKQLTIDPVGGLYGHITVPGDKSISHRAVMMGAISRGQTVIAGLLDCDDCNYTIEAFRNMGVTINTGETETHIAGVGLRGLKVPSSPLVVGQSGTTMRILPGILAGQNFETVIEARQSLSHRPMKRIVEPLTMMGVDISANPDGCPPLKIRGGAVSGIDYLMSVPSAQVKSAILFAGLYADGVTRVTEVVRSRDHTERMMEYFGAKVAVEHLTVTVRGGKELTGRSVQVPGDISSAAFIMVGAILLKGSKVRIDNVSINPTRAGILAILSRMGARCTVINRHDAFEPYGDIEIESGPTTGVVIEKEEIPAVIDELPILFVLSALSKGKTVVKGIAELRVKETDRVASMKQNIERMGGRFEIDGDVATITGVDRLRGADLESFGDHRTCMAMTIAALAAGGRSTIDDIECVSKSFPEFFKTIEMLKK